MGADGSTVDPEMAGGRQHNTRGAGGDSATLAVESDMFHLSLLTHVGSMGNLELAIVHCGRAGDCNGRDHGTGEMRVMT